MDFRCGRLAVLFAGSPLTFAVIGGAQRPPQGRGEGARERFVLAVIVHGTDRAGASGRSAIWDVRRQICGVLRCSLLCPGRAWTLTGRFFGIAPGYGYVN